MWKEGPFRPLGPFKPLKSWGPFGSLGPLGRDGGLRLMRCLAMTMMATTMTMIVTTDMAGESCSVDYGCRTELHTIGTPTWAHWPTRIRTSTQQGSPHNRIPHYIVGPFEPFRPIQAQSGPHQEPIGAQGPSLWGRVLSVFSLDLIVSLEIRCSGRASKCFAPFSFHSCSLVLFACHYRRMLVPVLFPCLVLVPFSFPSCSILDSKCGIPKAYPGFPLGFPSVPLGVP